MQFLISCLKKKHPALQHRSYTRVFYGLGQTMSVLFCLEPAETLSNEMEHTTGRWMARRWRSLHCLQCMFCLFFRYSCLPFGAGFPHLHAWLLTVLKLGRHSSLSTLGILSVCLHGLIVYALNFIWKHTLSQILFVIQKYLGTLLVAPQSNPLNSSTRRESSVRTRLYC